METIEESRLSDLEIDPTSPGRAVSEAADRAQAAIEELMAALGAAADPEEFTLGLARLNDIHALAYHALSCQTCCYQWTQANYHPFSQGAYQWCVGQCQAGGGPCPGDTSAPTRAL